MILKEIVSNPLESMDYLERQVNDGSPSGFSERNNTSPSTNPFLTESFYLIGLANADKIINYGNLPARFREDNFLYAHPDWATKNSDKIDVVNTNVLVSPTSSSRTVRLKMYPYYLKLSYPGVIGRMQRDLTETHINSVIQISNIFKSLCTAKGMPDTFAFLPEEGGRLYTKGSFKTGFIVRNSNPLGKRVNEIKYIVPAFSLFSSDRQSKFDVPLIVQILADKTDCSTLLLESLMFPLIDIYFTCSLTEGLNPEMHAQNLLIGFNENNDIVSLILRDLESVDKDITIRHGLDKDDFINDYKCIKEEDYNYKIKHSFMFDHKLGEYFFGALINCLVKYKLVDAANIINKLRAYVHSNYSHIIKGYFPADGIWYKFENTEIDRSTPMRPYLQMQNSILR